ncbi:MAG TPA: tetratricopeptide repeat protein [Chitinophagaceae bacterium]
MKKIFTYSIITLVLIAVGLFFMQSHHHASNDVYSIRERKGPSAQTSEWVSTRATANNLVEAIKNNPGDIKSRLQLAALFIQEARETGDVAYYNAAAMKYVNDVLMKEPANFEALMFKAIIQLSQHRFADGLATAMEAQKVNPYNAFVYGILVDAYVELGNYTAAVENADKMVSIRPDLRSYSRIAYLREIHGDIAGAIEAMKMAIEAGMPGNEGTEWCRVQLGHLFEQMGDITAATLQYNTSLENKPGYAYALTGLGRIALFNKDHVKAIEYYQKAYDVMPDPSFKEEQSSIYRLQGNYKKANALAKEAIHKLEEHHDGDDDHGHRHDDEEHNTDKELATAWLAINNTNEALEHALLEYKRRPDNIDVNELLAWIYYKKDDVNKALPHIKIALKTGSKNPTLLARAGLVYYKAGENATAKELLQQALQHNPNIDPALKNECSSILRNF